MVIDTRKLIEDENLWIAFKRIDRNNTGQISVRLIKQAIENAGGIISDSELNEVLESFEIGKDSKINFNVFKDIMTCFNNEEAVPNVKSTP